MERVTAATAGTAFVDHEDDEHTVQAKCSENSGFWYCITHRAGFANQFTKDSHIGKGAHVLVWFCREHGHYEVP